MNKEKKKVAFYTLGCKLNFAETSTISRSFPEDQFEKVPPGTRADVYVINTCSVTDTADRKCRQAIKKFSHLSPDAFIAVVGCYAQLKPEELTAIPGVDLVLGTNEKFDIAGYLGKYVKKQKADIHTCTLSPADSFIPSWSVDDRTRSFLKVQDGCDYKCSYCTIPLARGQSRNPDIATLVEEALRISEKGVKEIVLTGVNIGDFGKSTGDSFCDLLRQLIKVAGIERYRISSIEPNLLTDEIIELVSSDGKILPHFHIPLQSGCDRILGLMRRRYKRDVFEDRVKRIKEKMPLAGIGADVIIGFPGETDSDFEETFNFLKTQPISYLHVFSYSRRPGTVADGMGGMVPPDIKEQRSRKLIALSSEKHLEFSRINSGEVTGVLFEQTRSEGMITGFTGNYLRVEHPWQASLVNTIKNVRLGNVSVTGKISVELID